MKRKFVLSAVVLVLVMSLCLCGCGKKDATAEDGAMTLTGWTLTPETWSSPNGATVHLSAQVNHKDDTVRGEFVVRLGDGDVANEPCTWDKDTLTASVELNAADGYRYFVILTAADGTPTEISLDTEANPVDSSLVNLASALESYCNVVVTDSDFSSDVLTITSGTLEIQVPKLTDDGKTITCKEAALVLTLDGEEITRTTVAATDSQTPGTFRADLSGTTFSVATLEEEGQILLRLDATLSNGQFLTAEGCTWTYIDDQVVSAVG